MFTSIPQKKHEYKKFYEQLGMCVKFGIHEDSTMHKKGLEVLCRVDLVDEYAVQQLKEFDGKKLRSTTKEGPDLGGEDARKKLEDLKAEIEPLIKVTVRDSITESSCFLTKAQEFRDNSMTTHTSLLTWSVKSDEPAQFFGAYLQSSQAWFEYRRR